MGESFSIVKHAHLAFIVDLSDKRGEYIYSSLENLGYKVFAMDENFDLEVIQNFKFVYLYAPRVKLSLEHTEQILPNSIVFCLGMRSEIKEKLANNGIAVKKYFDDELFALNNAYLTALGTRMILEDNLIKPISNCSALVLGGGRVGRSVCKMLEKYKTSVTVATKDTIEFALLQGMCGRVVQFKNFDADLSDYDVIINTVPAVVLKQKHLKKCNKNCFILDLASMPGGVDFVIAKKLGLQVEHALGVPGRFLPIEASQIMLSSVLKRINNG
ncbi:MAG: hypothetical protein FWE13_00175 [Firmicutes bacterium]|nr:hypothetical protein [Bacillota bacterium]